MKEFLSYLIPILLVSFLVFLLIREVMCWYWKINELLRETRETNKYLKEIAAAVSSVPSIAAASQAGSAKDVSERVEISIDAKMKQLGITRVGDHYQYGSYTYDRPEDAVAYAEWHVSQMAGK